MSEHDVGSIVVVGDDDRLLGIVTDRDLVVRALAAGKTPDLPIAAVMSHEVASVADDAAPEDAARQMAVRMCRRLPVVDGEGRVLGVVSADDLVRHDARILEHLGLLLTPERRHERPSAAG
jgi:CBS domain-containing protein